MTDRFRTVELFAGCGLMSLGLERAGFEHVAFSEIDPDASRILSARWPSVPNLGDIREIDWREWAGKVNVVAGGFPCQPASLAGRRKGGADDRWLWPECARALDELRPRIAIFENVAGLFTAPGLPVRDSLVGRRELGQHARASVRPVRGGAFEAALTDLAALGYDAEWTCVTAAAFGAPHRRERVFIVAHAHEFRRIGEQEPHREEAGRVDLESGHDAYRLRLDLNGRPRDPRSVPGEVARDWLHGPASPDAKRDAIRAEQVSVTGGVRAPVPGGNGPHGVAPYANGLRMDLDCGPRDARAMPGEIAGEWLHGPPVAPLRRVDDGSTARLDRPRMRMLGNGVVPHCAEWVGRQAIRADRMRRAKLVDATD